MSLSSNFGVGSYGGFNSSVLNNMERITKPDYVPSAGGFQSLTCVLVANCLPCSADVLRARLRTEGAQEHRIDVEHGKLSLFRVWIVFDTS